jgi:hypothetical protein
MAPPLTPGDNDTCGGCGTNVGRDALDGSGLCDECREELESEAYLRADYYRRVL